MNDHFISKGIILSGGSGTRLRPLTDFVCKQLLPVYDKPLIYYPLTSLILAGIKEILIISTPKDVPILRDAIGNGNNWGISIEYAIQSEPRGIAEAFIVGENFIQEKPVMMILGDNILHKSKFTEFIKKSLLENQGATIFGFPVSDPKRFGVIEVDSKTNTVLSIEEKPKEPKSNLAAIGLYIYDGSVSQKARSLTPSARGELEITDLNNLYLKEKTLRFERLSRGDFWMDVGIFDAFSDAAQLVRLTETRLGLKFGCPEEATYVMQNISLDELKLLGEKYKASPYGTYLQHVSHYD